MNAERFSSRWLTLCVVNLRILIGFAFVPAGLKKVLGQPFTDGYQLGVFHDFLRAFHATGFFYQFVGTVQLLGAVLLMTQRFAFLGALLVLPVQVAILVLCWSTAVGTPTLLTATLLVLGTCGLMLWEWLHIAGARGVTSVKTSLWGYCGGAVLLVYGASCVLYGGVYRPRGADYGAPSFWLLAGIATFPVVTWWFDRRGMQRRAGGEG